MDFVKPGWRARIGLILPASCIVMEPEFYEMVPHGVSVHASRMRVDRSGKTAFSSIEQMVDEVETAAKTIKSVEPDIVAYCCTMGSFAGGVAGGRNLVKKIRDIVEVPVFTTSDAVVEALKLLGIQKVSVVTPYVEEVNQEEKAFLTESGLDVVTLEGKGFLTVNEFLRIDPYELYRLARRTSCKEADGLFISCTNSATLKILNLLERDLKKPVVASDQATIWKTLTELGLFKPTEDYGRLFAESKR